MKNLVKVCTEIEKVFKKHFGDTSLRERNDDILHEAIELSRFTSIPHLKEESGDLLCSLLMGIRENGWDPEEVIAATLKKIEGRALQYQAYGRKIKVAILGGAFNPTHEGHVAIAKFLLDFSGEFDQVWLCPCYSHMYHKILAPPEHRLKMCQLATASDRRIKVFDYEIKHKLGGETFHFVKKLMAEDFAKNKYNLSMVIGMDNANTFDSWVNYEELEKMIRFIVIPREGVKVDRKSMWYMNPPHMFLVPEKPLPDISSTEIRHQLHFTKVLKMNHCKYLNDDVFAYIKKNKLYHFNPKTNCMGVVEK